jgi:hypothetical protein
MQNSDIQRLCERRFLQLVEDYGLPDPDEVRLDEEHVTFIWNDEKVMVTINLTEFLEDDSHGRFYRDGLPA